MNQTHGRGRGWGNLRSVAGGSEEKSQAGLAGRGVLWDGAFHPWGPMPPPGHARAERTPRQGPLRTGESLGGKTHIELPVDVAWGQMLFLN